MRMAEQAEAFKRQHETLERQLTLPDRVMAVCEVCGIFISSMGEDGKRQVRGAGRAPGGLGFAAQRPVRPVARRLAGYARAARKEGATQQT
jgi:hypothetical protein